MSIKVLLFGLIISFSLNSSCWVKSNPTDGIYLVPKGYVGDIIIFFNQSDGVLPEVENGFYVYKIPADGILKVKTSGVKDTVNLSYFYVDKNDERQRVEYLRITGDRNVAGEPQNKFGNITQNDYENRVFVMSAGGLGSFNTQNGAIQYTSFIIGTPKDSEHLYDEMQVRISSFQRKFTQIR